MRQVQRSTRIENPTALDATDIRPLVARGERVIVQFSRPGYGGPLLASLDALCMEFGEELEVRFYGHTVDLGMLASLPHVQCLSLDCLDSVTNFAALQGLGQLARLHIGILELEEPNFLCWPNLHGLTHLTLNETRRAHFDLRPLENFRQLRRLFLSGRMKNMSAIGGLPVLSDVTLNIAHTASIAFVNELPALRALKFILGGRANLDELLASPLEELEIVWVKGFERLDRLERFPHLRRLSIDQQARLTRLVIDTEMPAMEELRIVDCKQFAQLNGLHGLTGLQTLWLYRTALDADTLLAQPLPGQLQTLGFYTGRTRADEALRLRLDRMGYGKGVSVS